MSLSNYLKETRIELAHVNWPSKKQSLVFTGVVVIISIVVAFFLGFFDFLFSKVLAYLIG